MDDSDLAFLNTTFLYRPKRIEPWQTEAQCSWATPIGDLLAAGYSFLPVRYSDNGYLFRGMKTGTGYPMGQDHFGHFSSQNELSSVEKAMGIYFLTHELADAVSIAYNNSIGSNGFILLIKSSYFNDQLENRMAAVLGIGDGGMVFKYPFLSAPVPLTEIEFIVTDLDTGCISQLPVDIQHKILQVRGNTRTEFEANTWTLLDLLGVVPCVPVPSQTSPGN